MQRRTLLRRSGALGAIGLAGCLSNGDPDDDPGSDDGTNSPTDTPAGPPGFSDYGVETTDTGCDGGNADTADVSFDPEANSATIDGVLQASNPCHEAAFEGMSYRDGNEILDVTIAATPDGSDVCQECVGAIDYEASLEFDGGLPQQVAVLHGTGEDATEITVVASDGSE